MTLAAAVTGKHHVKLMVFISDRDQKKSLEQVYTHIYIYTQAIYKKVATEPFSLNEKKCLKRGMSILMVRNMMVMSSKSSHEKYQAVCYICLS